MNDDLLIDLTATVDYIKGEVTEKSDSFSFEETVALQAALDLVKRAAAEAISLLETEQLRQLEGSGSRQVGDKVYARVPKRKVRFDHAEIAKHVRERAKANGVDRTTGVFDVELAVEEAVRMMGKLYVAPASKAKTTIIDELEIPKRDVIHRESTGHEIKIMDLGGNDDDE